MPASRAFCARSMALAWSSGEALTTCEEAWPAQICTSCMHTTAKCMQIMSRLHASVFQQVQTGSWDLHIGAVLPFSAHAAATLTSIRRLAVVGYQALCH